MADWRIVALFACTRELSTHPLRKFYIFLPYQLFGFNTLNIALTTKIFSYTLLLTQPPVSNQTDYFLHVHELRVLPIPTPPTIGATRTSSQAWMNCCSISFNHKQKIKTMVTITNYSERTRKDGTTFIALEITGGVELVQSQETSKFYATVRKTSIPCTFNETIAKSFNSCRSLAYC